MLIKYKGGRSFYEVSFNRKPYYFTKENNRILDIKHQTVINYIFSLPNRSEFEVVMEEAKPLPNLTPAPEEDKLKCSVCGFVAKSEQGLLVHSAKHKKGGK